MNSKIKQQIKKYGKLQDVFRTTQHDVRKAERLKWKDVNLDADVITQDKPKDFKSLQKEVRYWQDLQSPFKLKNDVAKPSGYQNDFNVPDYKNIQHTKNS